MQFKMFQESRKGARPSNQDRIGYVYTNDCLMMIVCDGMGGHARGEVASQIVVDSLAKSFRQSAGPKIKDPSSFLARSILLAHNTILTFAKAQDMPETPRTTCVAAIVQNGEAWWAHVGDSRLYLLRAGLVENRTIDHSHVQNLIDQGEITEAEATVHPDRNKIFNCLGQPVPPRIDVHSFTTLRAGDKLVLCSDGFWGPLLPEFVAKNLEHGHAGVNMPMLMDVAEALSGRGCDNLSVVSMTWIGLEGLAKNAAFSDPAAEYLDIDDQALEVSTNVILQTLCARPSFKNTHLA